MPGNGPQLADFWVGMASIPILGTIVTLVFRNRAALSAEILSLQKSLAQHQLDVATDRASNTYVKDVETRIDKRLNRIDDKLDTIHKCIMK